ncbi:hypothetical protein B9Z55_024704 [Caenorhabditis nigoni]|uniref:Uncharacterized protein n=1 Tax=Caenorhabditis nigoni TaxID=1611254 RepID=A0A2G5SV63_9PELO|nr:hypothetical protein B9Z55_024704 [Caenorhabditis nigoni]
MIFSEDPKFESKVPYSPKSKHEFEARNTWRRFKPGVHFTTITLYHQWEYFQEYRYDKYDDTVKEIREKEKSAKTKTVPIVADANADASVSEDFDDSDEKTPLIPSKN